MSNKAKRRKQKRNRVNKSQRNVSQETMPIDMTRSAPAELETESHLRMNLTVRAETVDEETRSVEVVLATENRVLVYDVASRQVIEEILLMSGMVPPPNGQLPMVEDHRIRSLDDQFGSVRDIRTAGSRLRCRYHFADLSELHDDDQAKRVERNWLKTKQGHIKGVSLGYRVLAGVMIPEGQSRKVNGKVYTATDRPLRVSTRWRPREGSLLVVQADPASSVRTEAKGMNPKLLTYLQSQGLRPDATAGEAWDYMAKLGQQQRAAAEKLIQPTDQVPDTFVRSSEATDITDPNVAAGTPPSEVEAENVTRSAADVVHQETQTLEQVTDQLSDTQRSAVDQLVQTQLRDERQRVNDIQRTFQDAGIDNAPLMQRAINENWSPQQTAMQLLPMVRGQRSEPVGQDMGHLGIHVTRAADVNALSCALLLREGVPLDHGVFESSYAVRSLPQVLRQSLNSDQRQQAMEIAHRHETMSLVDICRAGLALDGMTIPHNRDEMVRAAVSSGSVQAIFTTNVSARVLSCYMDAEDTTPMWTTEADVANFQTNERATMGKYGALQKHARGGTADDMDTDASKEEYKIARYSGKVFTDEMDIIDDRLGALDSVTPEDMGLAARQLRPDLVYSILLANASLQATGDALFTSGQNNLFGAGSALSITNVGVGYTAMQKQRIKERILNLKLKYLLVPADLALVAGQILESLEIREANSANGTKNYLHGKGIVAIADDRLGAAGVVDPNTKTQHTGSATNYFGAAQPGVNGAKTIEVGYRRGTGRAPQINTFVKNDGQWGIGHAIKHDIGAKALDYRGLQKHTGAA